MNELSGNVEKMTVSNNNIFERLIISLIIHYFLLPLFKIASSDKASHISFPF